MGKMLTSRFLFVIGIIFSIVIMCLGFYWYEYRPSKIKHDCSWVKVVDPAIPAKPAITKDEAEKSKEKYDLCEKNNLNTQLDNYVKNGYIRLFDDNGNYLKNNCNSLLKEEHSAIPEIPAKEWYRKANKGEYNFCIHEKGL